MTNETIGHYASHPGGGTVGWNKDKGFHGDIRVGANQLNKIQPSDLELRIRKDVMDAMEELIDRSGPNTYLERRVGELGSLIQRLQ